VRQGLPVVYEATPADREDAVLMKITGAVFWRGISPWTAEPIVAIATGLDGQSHNAKTGPMIQTWVLVRNLPPQEAKRRTSTRRSAATVSCAVTMATTPAAMWRSGRRRSNIWNAFRAGNYPDVDGETFAALLEGRHVRVCAYGDPAALPFEFWRDALALTAGFVSYTHQWRTCDPRFKTIAMASVDTVDEFHAAHLAGWRTFRIRGAGAGLVSASRPRNSPLEFACPASDEMQHRTTCQRCGLCRGTSSPARSVAIVAHGHNGAMAAFHRSRPAAEVARA
jgi:hypothetical protein